MSGSKKKHLLKAIGLADPVHPVGLLLSYIRRIVTRADKKAFRLYLGNHSSPKLHIGASNRHLKGWLNTDLVPGESVARLDATKPFPLPSDRFECVQAEHMIEHIPYLDGVKMLKECHRILRPNGVVRIVTPNLKRILELYASDLSPAHEVYLEWMRKTFTPETPEPAAVFVINTFFRSWGHQFIYDERTLRDALHAAGFRELRLCRLGESVHPELLNIENIDRYPVGLLDFESIAIEAVKA
jgi:predicted SAM-dependent methyltransferase